MGFKDFNKLLKNTLYMQTTLDDGLWKVQKRLEEFW